MAYHIMDSSDVTTWMRNNLEREAVCSSSFIPDVPELRRAVDKGWVVVSGSSGNYSFKKHPLLEYDHATWDYKCE